MDCAGKVSRVYSMTKIREHSGRHSV